VTILLRHGDCGRGFGAAELYTVSFGFNLQKIPNALLLVA
jgi:hypothetical protein